MDVGLALPQYDFEGTGAEPSRLPWQPIEAAARQAEQLGFRSLWLSDHLFLDRSRYGGEPRRCVGLDPLPALGALARVTRQAKLGTLTLCGPLRRATVTAKQLATVDVLSGGRLIAGVGAGWSEQEIRSADLPFRAPWERLCQLEELVRVLRGMFAGGPFTYEGRYERAVAARCLPRPVQGSELPIWVGGSGDRLLRLVARVADGWNTVWTWTTDSYRDRLRVLHSVCALEGRDPATVVLSVGVFALVGEDEEDLARRFDRLSDRFPHVIRGASLQEWRKGRLVATVDDLPEQIEQWEQVGVTCLVLSPPPFPFSVPRGDDLAMLAAACRL